MESLLVLIPLIPIWIHIVAAMMWIGGLLFLSLIVVPTIRETGRTEDRRQLFRRMALRFRFAVWIAVLVLLTTGPLLVVLRNDTLAPSLWPTALRIKLILVAGLITLTAVHDFWLGPVAARGRQWSVRLSPWVARFSLVLALGVVLCAVALARS